MEQVAMDCEIENKTDVRGYKNTDRVVIKLIACAHIIRSMHLLFFTSRPAKGRVDDVMTCAVEVC